MENNWNNGAVWLIELVLRVHTCTYVNEREVRF